jgi:predicted transcriptional regulator
MNKTCVKDLMISLNNYALVDENATVWEAMGILRRAEKRLASGQQPPRAVLVMNSNQNVVGQLGHLDFVKALEPKYHLLGNLEALSMADVNSELLDTIIDSLDFWHSDLGAVCNRLRTVSVKSIMHPISESIDESAQLAEAVHKIVLWQTPRVLVTRAGCAVGVLRLADIIAVICDYMEPGA